MKLFLTIVLLFSSLQAAPLNIGFDTSALNNFSKKDIKVALDIWLIQLSVNAGYTAKITYYDNPEKMADDLNHDKVDYVSGFGLMFVSFFDLSKLSDGFTGARLSRDDSKFVVIVPNNNEVMDWKDLSNAVIGIQEDDKGIELYIKLNLLKIGNAKPKIERFKNRQTTLLKLFFGKVDAAVVTLGTFNLARELNPQITKRLKIMAISDVKADHYGFYRKNLSESIKENITASAKKFIDDEYGRQMLLLLQSDKIVDSRLTELEPMQKLFDSYNKLKKERQ